MMRERRRTATTSLSCRTNRLKVRKNGIEKRIKAVLYTMKSDVQS